MAARPQQQPEMEELIKQLDFTYMDLPELIAEDDDECMEPGPSDSNRKPDESQQQPAAGSQPRNWGTSTSKPAPPQAESKSVSFCDRDVMKSRERSNPHVRGGATIRGATCLPGTAPVHPPTPYPHWLSSRGQKNLGGLLQISEEVSPVKPLAGRIQQSEESWDMEE